MARLAGYPFSRLVARYSFLALAPGPAFPPSPGCVDAPVDRVGCNGHPYYAGAKVGYAAELRACPAKTGDAASSAAHTRCIGICYTARHLILCYRCCAEYEWIGPAGSSYQRRPAPGYNPGAVGRDRRAIHSRYGWSQRPACAGGHIYGTHRFRRSDAAAAYCCDIAAAGACRAFFLGSFLLAQRETLSRVGRCSLPPPARLWAGYGIVGKIDEVTR